MSVLIPKGLRSVTVKAVEFSEPDGVRGTNRDTVATMWEARICNMSAAKPDYVARDKNPDVALASAAELFAKQQKDVVSEGGKRPAPEPELDQEAEDLI